MNYKLIAYAQDFTSFLLENLNNKSDKVENIILFGSVSRGEENKKSDIDIFIDIIDDSIENDLEKEINKIKDKFYDSIKIKKYWLLLGIKNEINCIVGKLNDWEDIHRSIISNGIVLYGKYKKDTSNLPYVLFSIESTGERKKDISLWRRLYGYKQKIGKKEYIKQGLINEFKGEKIARGVIIIPIEHATKTQKFLKENKMPFKMIEFWSEKR